MKNERLKQFAWSILVVLSLVVSSFSTVCVCAPHEQSASDDAHCQPQKGEHSAHEHSHEVSGEHENSTENVLAAFSEDADCCCVQSAPRVYAKAESVRIEKQATAVLPFSPVEFRAVSHTLAVKNIDFAAPFYLSDSSRNLTPGRAPPRS